MRYGKMLMLAVVVILLIGGRTMAAELTVTKQGTGDGIVYGEGIECGYDCTEIYPDETILHLRAHPDEYSTFEGWLVDGEPQEGTLIIRKDITVTAIFEKIPIPDFETVSTHPSEFVYFNDDNYFWPLYDTKKEIVGVLQPAGSEGDYQWDVIIPDKATLTIPSITSVVIPTQGDRVVAYGEVLLDPVVEQSRINLYLYSFDGTLLKFVETRINSPFRVATVGHTGDLWAAGSRGYTMHDPFVIRRYTPDGEMMWEQPLSDNSPDQLVLSPDNSYAALTLRKQQKLGPGHTIMQIYDSDGRLVHERELPRYFYGVEFVSDQTVLIHSSDRWEFCRLDNLETPFASGEFAGNLAGPYPFIVLPLAESFLVKTVVDEESVRGYYLQAVHRETGEVLAERLFETISERIRILSNHRARFF